MSTTASSTLERLPPQAGRGVARHKLVIAALAVAGLAAIVAVAFMAYFSPAMLLNIEAFRLCM